MAAYRYEKKVLLTQTHYHNREMEEVLLGGVQKEELYRDIGIDAILRLIRTGNFIANSDTESLIRNFILSVGKGGVNLLPGTSGEYSKALEGDMSAYLPYLYGSLKGSYDMIFTDAVSGDNPVSRMLWKEADILAVTLSQNKAVIKECLLQYQFPFEKTVFLIGSYQKASVNTIKNLEKTYQELKGRLYAVPYHTSYMDVLSEGMCQELFLKSLAFKNKAGLTEFFSYVSKLTEMLLDKASDEGGAGLDI
ncbi:hypothetical protein SAMN02745217_01372 [Anaerocolumna xylanovorans DSM 12503]|uniref:Uncharacterized protein n=2 Tax=Anaerocolumna TaxID=1843210 RepID=A0A1M7Y433_9FIRM|nr:hypothetical protein SAMN02745217_01372 [Anaerocolumna xylanovorans DSM 12503]